MKKPHANPSETHANFVDLAKEVHRWFATNARDLPWRFSEDPYAVWVSEIMLQQTRVDTVIPRFQRFMKRFPTVEALASASLDEVRSEWAGLGYYRRCKNLWSGARFVRDELAGVIPDTPRELKIIPGVGAYTAAAIAALAFNKPVAAVDGNVLRVLGRVLGMEVPIDSSALKREVQRFGDSLVENGSPRVLAQALMEIGAILCRPTSATCTECPLAEPCLARMSGTPTAFPKPSRRKEPHRWSGIVAVCVDPEGRILLEKRPEQGLLAGLWMPPCLIGAHDDAMIVEATNNPEQSLRNLLAQPIHRIEQPAQASWRFTHILLEPQVIRVRCKTLIPGPNQAAKTLAEWNEEAVPSATYALLSAVGERQPLSKGPTVANRPAQSA